MVAESELLSPDDLARIREEAHAGAVERARAAFLKEQQLGGGVAAPEVFLSAEEQQRVTAFYEAQFSVAWKKLKATRGVQVTSQIFFKRFFLQNSILEFDHKLVWLTCLFLGAKANEHFLSSVTFLQMLGVNVEHSALTSLEFEVFRRISFELSVESPFRALYGFFLSAQAVLPEGPALKKVHDKAMPHVDKALCTDLPFTHPMSQLALAAFVMAGKDEGLDMDRFVTFLAEQGDDMVPNVSGLKQRLQEIESIIRAWKPPGKPDNLASKIQSCFNPEFKEGTKCYQQRKAADEKAKDMKRNKKLQALQEKEKLLLGL